MSSPVWHPFTQHALTPDATLVKAGEGAWLDVAPSGLRIASAATATSPLCAARKGEVGLCVLRVARRNAGLEMPG